MLIVYVAFFPVPNTEFVVGVAEIETPAANASAFNPNPHAKNSNAMKPHRLNPKFILFIIISPDFYLNRAILAPPVPTLV